MKLIACQYDIAWEDKPANHQRLSAWLRERRPEPGTLVLLPEMFATGFSMNVAKIAEGNGAAEGADRPSERWLAELAAELGVYLLAGVVNVGPDGRGRNQAVVFDPQGAQLARYAKLHPFSHAGEDDHFAGGDRLALFDWQGLKVAPVVCYDLRFPELFRHLTRAGAELFAVIANWPAARAHHWRPLLQARAIENQAFVVGLNRCGQDPNVPYSGQSVAYDPQGRAVAEAGEQPAMLDCDIDREVLTTFRAKFPALRDMRADLLGPRWPRVDGADRD
ncbi:carbon-nitrogen family hydrolase [Phycisphaerales bacterium AB-hyl4]|uniref:Carbon-nitrogen family hydrolase n=1 Tax=Natronomicrosphaera hydrolytica TaxID=3242702 RepID=A0ABV4TZV6_9BACT